LRSVLSFDKIINRSGGSAEASYYQLSQAVELSIKALVKKETGKAPPMIHDKQELAEQYQNICGFSDGEMNTIIKLKQLKWAWRFTLRQQANRPVSTINF